MANKQMKTLTVNKNITYDIVDAQARNDIETIKINVTVDETLTQAGKSADAKATGDAIQQLSSFVDQDVKINASPTFDVVTANKVIGAVYL